MKTLSTFRNPVLSYSEFGVNQWRPFAFRAIFESVRNSRTGEESESQLMHRLGVSADWFYAIAEDEQIEAHEDAWRLEQASRLPALRAIRLWKRGYVIGGE